MPLDDKCVLARRTGLTWIRNKEGIVFEKGFALNDAAAAFFLAIDGNRSVREICDKLQQQYDADDGELTADMLDLAEEMCEAELLTVVPS